MNIPVNSPKGIKLLTKAKYVTDDIEVVPVLQDKSVTPADTVQSVSADDGYAGLGKVTVAGVETETGAATPSAAVQVITPSEGKFFSEFTVNATPTETKNIDANGTFTPSVGKFFSSVTVNVNEQKPEQEKTITVTENGTEVVTPDEGYALSKVTAVINVDTAKPEQTKSVDIASMSPVTVTSDAGHVLTEVTVTPKAPLADTGDATAAAGDILAGKTAYANGAKVTGTIELADAAATPTLEAQELTPPAGTYYKKVTVAATPLDATQTVTAGTTAKTVNPAEGNLGIKTVTVNPTPSGAKTITPTKDTQTVNPDSGKLLSSVTVNPIPDEYIVPTGSKTITENGTVDVTEYTSAIVNVQPKLQALAAAPATTEVTVTPSDGYDGLSKVVISPINTETKTVTAGTAASTVDASSGKFMTQVTVNPTPSETKTVTTNGTVTPSSGKLLSSVAVNVPPYAQEVSTTTAMNALLVAANVGRVYKFTGTTDNTYTNGDLYIVEG